MKNKIAIQMDDIKTIDFDFDSCTSLRLDIVCVPDHYWATVLVFPGHPATIGLFATSFFMSWLNAVVACCAHVPGFAALEAELLTWLREHRGIHAELFYAHALRQSPKLLAGTGFDVHQDTEEFDFIEYTVVVKLTADEPGEAPSSMRVLAAAGGDFHYGASAGSAGCFTARLHHASVAPTSEREHLKIAFFFRRSQREERLAARPEVADAELARLQRPDCGQCQFCRDMTKFGGPNKLRQRCVERGGK